MKIVSFPLLVEACPNVGTPYNGTKTYMSERNHYFEGAQLGFECNTDLILVGSSFRACEYDTEKETLAWTGQGDEVMCVSKCNRVIVYM